MSRVAAEVQPTLQQPASPAGMLERPIGALPDSSLQALVPFCRQFRIQELCPSTRAILAWLMTIPDAPLGGGPLLCAAGSAAPNDPPATPRQLASSHYIWPNTTPRIDQRAERRHGARRALHTASAGPSGAVFTL